MPAPAASPAAISNTFPSVTEGLAPIEDLNTSNMQPSNLPEDSGLGLYHVSSIVMDSFSALLTP